MFQYPSGIVRSNTNLGALYGLSSFWNRYYSNGQLFNDLLSSGTNLMGLQYVKLLQNMSPISLNLTSLYESQEIRLETFPAAGPYTLSNPVVSCAYIVDRPVLPRVILENGVDFTIQNGAIVWANPERISTYPFALQTTAAGTQMAAWLIDALIDEGWLYKYYGSLLNVQQQPSSTSFSSFLQGVLYMQVQGPIVDVISAGLQITLGLPLALFDEVVIETFIMGGEYGIVTNMTAYSVPLSLNLKIPLGTQLMPGQALFPAAANVVDWQAQDKWWVNLVIPPAIMPQPPQVPLCLSGNWADQIMESMLKTHSFLVNLGVSVESTAEFSSVLRNIIPTYTYPWVFNISYYTETLVFEDALIQTEVYGNCERLPQIDLFTRNNTEYTRGCPKFNRYTIPQVMANRNLLQSSLASSVTGMAAYFPRAQLGLQGAEFSYYSAVMGNRNMAAPRTRGSYTNTRGLLPDSVNPWPTLVPLFVVNGSYLKNYVANITSFFTLVENATAATIPFPASYEYLNWYFPSDLSEQFLNLSEFPAGSSLAIFNLLDDIYGVCLVPESSVALTALVASLKFGEMVNGLGNDLVISGSIPLNRSAGSLFNNPFYFGKGAFLKEAYRDSLNTAAVPIDRSGTIYLQGSNQ